MRSPARVALALGLVAPGCQAFLGAPRAAPPTSSAAHQQQPCYSVVATTSHNNLFSLVRSRVQPLSRSRSALCMSGDDEAAGPAAGPMPEQEEKPATRSPSELMDDAAEADFVARASTAPATGPAIVGPAKQPEEDKRKQREKSFELKPPESNKWASGAFKRGLVLQAVVLSFVVFLSLKPEEVGQLAICAPFSKGGGCVGFVEWAQIVFLNAPIPPM